MPDDIGISNSLAYQLRRNRTLLKKGFPRLRMVPVAVIHHVDFVSLGICVNPMRIGQLRLWPLNIAHCVVG